MNFTGKAILCETWEQMEHLAKIAEGMGITAQPDQYNEDNFVAGAR